MYAVNLTQILNDERCGIFLLAGLDSNKSGHPKTLTIHAVNGTLTKDCERFIAEQVQKFDSKLNLRFRRHALKHFFNTKCMEHFNSKFDHEHIIHDPTGVFGRSIQLVKLAGILRNEFGHWLENILWQSDSGKLQLVFTRKSKMSSLEDNNLLHLKTVAWSVFEENFSDKLGTAVLEINTAHHIPNGTYTHVDAQSSGYIKHYGSSLRLLAKVSAVAAAIGLGSVVAANAYTVPHQEEKLVIMPGVSGLSGLTSLGENALGIRNSYRSLGGLRLYFGNSEPILLAACGMTAFVRGQADCPILYSSEPGTDGDRSGYGS